MKINNDQQLINLLSSKGFLVNVDYPTRSTRLHKIGCRYCDPRNAISVKPLSKRINGTGEFWFSELRKEASWKAIQIANTKGYTSRICKVCNP